MAKPIHQLAVSCMTQHLAINPARGQLGVAQLALLDEGNHLDMDMTVEVFHCQVCQFYPPRRSTVLRIPSGYD